MGIVVVAVLVVLGAGAAFGWLNYGDRLAELPFFNGAPGSTASIAAADSVSAADFAAFQQQTSASLQAATQLLATQQAELKRLSDQIAGLTARIDGLQGAMTPAAAAPAQPATTTLAAPVPEAAAAAPRPTAPRKRPAPSRPAGAISIGGAPLPGAAPAVR